MNVETHENALTFTELYVSDGLVFSCRWFDVMQKVSNQLRSSITNVTRHRGDKVKQLIDRQAISLVNPPVVQSI